MTITGDVVGAARLRAENEKQNENQDLPRVNDGVQLREKVEAQGKGRNTLGTSDIAERTRTLQLVPPRRAMPVALRLRSTVVGRKKRQQNTHYSRAGARPPSRKNHGRVTMRKLTMKADSVLFPRD